MKYIGKCMVLHEGIPNVSQALLNKFEGRQNVPGSTEIKERSETGMRYTKAAIERFGFVKRKNF